MALYVGPSCPGRDWKGSEGWHAKAGKKKRDVRMLKSFGRGREEMLGGSSVSR